MTKMFSAVRSHEHLSSVMNNMKKLNLWSTLRDKPLFIDDDLTRVFPCMFIYLMIMAQCQTENLKLS